ncbi:unnamed protein product [Durusdinium trenchii]|uniref:Uncharacterized protein n=1 Tax=Durusdinium trenchii TaxID=1381693 RepID=A0ABP0J7M3_9DINO
MLNALAEEEDNLHHAFAKALTLVHSHLPTTWLTTGAKRAEENADPLKALDQKYHFSSQSVFSLCCGRTMEREVLDAPGGRDFMIQLAQQSLDSLRATVMQEDQEEDLPRVFFPYLSWTKVDLPLFRQHIFQTLGHGQAEQHQFSHHARLHQVGC